MITLRYIGKMDVPNYPKDTRMWNLIEPELPGYDYGKGHKPTFTLEGLKQRGLI